MMADEPKTERRKSYRENNPEAVRLSQLRFVVNTAKKREADSDFDREYREKEAARKKRYRAEQKALAAFGQTAAKAPFPTAAAVEDEGKENSVNITPESKKSRQALAGLLQRKKASKVKHDTIGSLIAQKKQMEELHDNLEDELADLTRELKRIETENAQLRTKMKENDLWLKETFKYCTTATKRSLKNAYQCASGAGELQKGTTLRILRNTGINFSKKLPANEEQTSELKKKVEKWAKENSSEMPDMRNQKKGIRYRHHYLTCLHEDFRHSHPDVEISYSTFSAYWPKNIIQPKPGDYANCVCEKCENPALKVRALKTHKLLSHEHELESILRDARMEDYTSEEEMKTELEMLLAGPKASVQEKYLQWEKVETVELNHHTGRAKQATTQRVAKYASAKELVLQTLTDYQQLKDHLNRNTVIKDYVREKRDEALESDDKAMEHVDWAENGQIVLPNEVQSAYFGGRVNFSLHTGYEYSKDKSGGFVSLSDENNHKAEAIAAAMEPKMKELAERGIKEVTIVSDSPISQYRNGKMTYLTSTWAKQFKMKITWIFTEAGHGKSAADGIGGGIKNKVADKVNMAPDTVMANVEDIKNHIETSTDITIHTQDDIRRVAESLPKKIGQLVGAREIHELVFDVDGKIKKKNLPDEAYYQPVKIKIGRAIVRRRDVVEPEGEMLAQMEVDLDDAMLEPRVETPSSRRRRAAYDDIVRELDAEFDFDDE